MISFNNLGFMGELGNQMFQYAALKGIAAHKNFIYSLPVHNFKLKECFKLPKTPQNNNTYKPLLITTFEFDSHFFNTCPDNIDIMGYFQTEKYFKHIELEIRNDFTFKESIQNKCLSFFKEHNIQNDTISLHIRRTTYLKDLNFIKLNLSYYVDALKILNNNLQVIVFSDDIDWCKKQLLFKNKRFIFSDLKNQFLDLCAMSMCKYHIIANSTFSWWGSWLAKSKKTIAPRLWFDKNLKQWNTKDLYLNDWIII